MQHDKTLLSNNQHHDAVVVVVVAVLGGGPAAVVVEERPLVRLVPVHGGGVTTRFYTREGVDRLFGFWGSTLQKARGRRGYSTRVRNRLKDGDRNL